MRKSERAEGGEGALLSIQTRLLSFKKALAFRTENPFDAFVTARQLLTEFEQVKSAEDHLRSLLATLQIECVERRLEFWNGFSNLCRDRGWNLVGSTNRRFVANGIFVELDGDNVTIEELDLRLIPSPTAVLKAIAPTVSAIEKWSEHIDEFLRVLELGYAMVPDSGAKPLETVYKACVFSAQKTAFWKALRPAAMVAIVRPVFRACLSDLVATGRRTSDGRRVVFGTASPGVETWEMLSPGERRVVQVGRIGFEEVR